MFKLAISGQSIGQYLSYEEVAKFIHDLGVVYMEIWPANIPLLKNGLLDKGNRNIAEYTKRDLLLGKKILTRYGIKVGCVTNAVSGGFKNDHKFYRKSLLSALEAARILETKIVNTYFGADERYEKEFTKVIGSVLKLAEEYKITIVLENEAHDATGHVDGMLAILKTVNSRWFKTNYDACNYYQGNEESFPYAYERLKPYIGYIHLKGGCRFKQSVHPPDIKGLPFRKPNENISIGYVPLDESAINFDGLLARLKNDNYNSICTLESHVYKNKLLQYLKKEVSWIKKRMRTK